MFDFIEKFKYERSYYVHMVNVNISIKKEAYNFLKSIKTKEKSFSDVILSFKSENDKIMKFFGVLKDTDWDTKEKNMNEFRSSFNKRLV